MVMSLAVKSTAKAARVGVVFAVIARLNVVTRKPMHATRAFDPSTYPIYMMKMIVPSLILFAGVMIKTLTPWKIIYRIQRIILISLPCSTMMVKHR